MYIWQAKDWPHFTFEQSALDEKLSGIEALQSKLLGQVKDLPQSVNVEANMDALIQNAIRTSAIEGENLDVASVRSSVAKHLGLTTAGLPSGTKQTEALVKLLLEASNDIESPLSLAQLCRWQTLLFPEPPLLHELIVGRLRDDDPMQVVSQQGHKQIIHFQAPAKTGLEGEVNAFLDWFNLPPKTQGAIRAGIAHLWFITLHPFDDGNGRLARAITDRALAQCENTSIRFYSISAAIESRRTEYYDQLEAVQNIKSSSPHFAQQPLNITTWLVWFLDVLTDALEQGYRRIDSVLAKSQFWYRHSQTILSTRQVKVLNRLLDNVGEEFIDGINASKYQRIAKVSKATATRDLAELLEKGCLIKSKAGGRSTRYQINYS